MSNTTSEWMKTIELKGEHVTLKPLKLEHRNALVEAATDGKLWELWFTAVPSEKSIDTYLEKAFTDAGQGVSLPFVVIDNATQKVIGCTRFCNAVPQHRRVEIGYTWYAKSYQKTAVNTECKWLLLDHAFSQLNAIAVEFRTHWHNHASRNAIARLGAKQDGVIRNATIEPDGALRDTVVFSIIQSEWPSVSKSLLAKLAP
ncbi:GNAT family N-acetyltransferase [Flocculibacter collagenilyticus]|uniref:GNAT family N-acetyltransferase n=1 Tax=Flocculibacter collagenilyticus TaxID=2744479 RepID=UPI0018F7C2DC|nr:GNAT family protein [Flocculibacter collagenilyticus]